MPRIPEALTVGGLQVLDAIDGLSALGLHPDSLCRHVGLDRTALLEATARVPLATVLELFDVAARQAGDPLVGLHAGARTEPRSPLMYLLLSSAHLGQGLDSWRRFGSLIADGLQIDVEVDGALAHLRFRGADIPPARLRHAVEYLVMKCVRALRRALGPQVPVSAVHFPHAPGGSVAEVVRTLGCRVAWEGSDCRVMFPAAGLSHSPTLANPIVAAQVEQLASSLAPVRSAAKSLRERVVEETRTLLVAGRRADRAALVARLHMSPRTLQRRLETEGTTLRAARDEALWQTVEALLLNPSLTLEAVALSVGFADLPAFSKAFKRSRGCTPSQWRRDHRGGDAVGAGTSRLRGRS